jgi:adenylyltransferase/sulfurtransferase
MERQNPNFDRYHRQIVYAPFGVAGQQRLGAAKALVVGVGGLGSWAAELLTRAGVGMLRLVDDDRVELVNVHRQALYDESDAEAQRPKAQAAARRLRQINAAVEIQPVIERLKADNIARLAEGVDVILDGADNFATRFIVNDFCVKNSLPWVFAGVVGAEGQVMSVIPGCTACLRCVYDSPAPPCVEPTCRAAGVLGPAVAAIASMQAMEALKILAGMAEKVSPFLTKLDFWTNQLQRIDTSAPAANCPCCKQRLFEYLEGD